MLLEACFRKYLNEQNNSSVFWERHLFFFFAIEAKQCNILHSRARSVDNAEIGSLQIIHYIRQFYQWLFSVGQRKFFI